MARKKKTYTRLEEVQNYVSNEEKIIEEIITPKIEETYAEKVRNLRSKGFDNNRIAAMLMIRRELVDKVK